MRIGVFRKTSLPVGANVAIKTQSYKRTKERNPTPVLVARSSPIATQQEIIITPGKTDEHDHDMP
jgi:hypothetical protein